MTPIPTPLFESRDDAGAALAEAVAALGLINPIVYALPRGGAPIGVKVADALGAPLDLILVRKLGVPGHAELAFGATVDGASPLTVLNANIVSAAGLTDEAVAKVQAAEACENDRRRALYFQGAERPDPRGRATVIVDDGLATGATARAAIRAVKRRGAARVVLAVPVGPADTIASLRSEADEIVCLETPEPFQAIGLWYRDFRQLSDADVLASLASAPLAA